MSVQLIPALQPVAATRCDAILTAAPLLPVEINAIQNSNASRAVSARPLFPLLSPSLFAAMSSESSSSSSSARTPLQKADWENAAFPLGGGRIPKGMEEHANWQDLPEVREQHRKRTARCDA